jgi:hypothetical protein
MTVMIHAERVKAHVLGDLAERMVYVAWQMGRLVRDEDRDSIGEFLATLTDAEKDALLVVQAAMIPVDTSDPETLLAHVTWDEYGRTLPAVLPALPPVSSGPRELEPCGTLAAYRRHQARGEPVVECGCEEGARARWRQVKRQHAREAVLQGRVEDYAELKAAGLTRGEAAERMKVTARTIQRYETALRAAAREADGAAA